MLNVTPAARKCLSTRLDRRKAADGFAMRFTRRAGGWRLCLDRAQPDDTSFTHKGRRVLVLDEAVAAAMQNMKLDVRATESGLRLKLRRRKDLDHGTAPTRTR